MRHPLLTPALIVVSLLCVAGCFGGRDAEDPSPEPSYTPVADETLFQTIADLQGVESSKARHRDSFGSEGYYVTLQIASDADAARLADHTYAILRQGRPSADVTLEVRQDGAIVDTSEIISSGAAAELAERYGPQPGTGEPPTE